MKSVPATLDLGQFFARHPHLPDVGDWHWLMQTAADVADQTSIKAAHREGLEYFHDEYVAWLTDDIADALTTGRLPEDSFLTNPALRAEAVEEAAAVACRALFTWAEAA